MAAEGPGGRGIRELTQEDAHWVRPRPQGPWGGKAAETEVGMVLGLGSKERGVGV